MSTENTHETRPCFRCQRGRVLHSDDPMSRPRWTTCQHCGGTGYVTVYVYPNARSPKACVRRADERQLMWFCYHGTPQEQRLAEKEMRRRDSR